MHSRLMLCFGLTMKYCVILKFLLILCVVSYVEYSLFSENSGREKVKI